MRSPRRRLAGGPPRAVARELPLRARQARLQLAHTAPQLVRGLAAIDMWGRVARDVQSVGGRGGAPRVPAAGRIRALQLSFQHRLHLRRARRPVRGALPRRVRRPAPRRAAATRPRRVDRVRQRVVVRRERGAGAGARRRERRVGIRRSGRGDGTPRGGPRAVATVEHAVDDAPRGVSDNVAPLILHSEGAASRRFSRRFGT